MIFFYGYLDRIFFVSSICLLVLSSRKYWKFIRCHVPMIFKQVCFLFSFCKYYFNSFLMYSKYTIESLFPIVTSRLPQVIVKSFFDKHISYKIHLNILFPPIGTSLAIFLLPQSLHMCQPLLSIKRGCLFTACYFNELLLLKDFPNHMDHGVNKIYYINKEVYENILSQWLIGCSEVYKMLYFLFPYYPSFEESKVRPWKHITASDTCNIC